MREFANTCEAIAGTTKKLEKIRIVAEYLNSRPVEEAAVSAVFLSGKPFPAWEEATLQVGGRSLWEVIGQMSGKSDAELTAAYRRLGDVGAVAGEVLGNRKRNESSVGRPTGENDRRSIESPELSVLQLKDYFQQIASSRGSTAKTVLVR